MEHDCGACNGSGECQNDHHSNWVKVAIEGAFAGELDDSCPECGESASSEGTCQVCGGSGIQDD